MHKRSNKVVTIHRGASIIELEGWIGIKVLMARYIIDETGVESRPPRKTCQERFMLPSKPLFETMVFDGSS